MLKFSILLAVVAVCYGQRTKYILYTRGNPRETLPNTGIIPDASSFDGADDTIILIHDHLGRPADAFNRLIRTEILAYRKRNVIEVDWENDAKGVYSTASRQVESVAEELTEFIEGLVDPLNTIHTDLNKLHLVGFGLGAHVAGIASRGLGDDTVGRITGLDPSGSGWGSSSKRLKSGDAGYVEVIHTDGSGLNANGIGENIGQVNIYANGGSNQPGCFTHSCSHNRAYELFAASISNSNLVAYPCSTMVQMNLNRCRGDEYLIGGISISKSSAARLAPIFRINTKRSWPF